MTHEEAAKALAGTHQWCDDPWYSCPLAPDGCTNEFYKKDECNCGYEKRVQAIIAAFHEQRAQEVRAIQQHFDTLCLRGDRVTDYRVDQFDNWLDQRARELER
jgi:hypothetical protein